MSEHRTLVPILEAVLAQYRLPPAGDHGVAHWARVLENGERLAASTGADVEVVRLFAVLHDARRFNESDDPDHGPRAARFAQGLRGTLIDLPDARFKLLHRACSGHTHERTHPDPTIRACWDADRLDLGRVGITPIPILLCTDAARDPAMLNWADARGKMRFRPDLIRDAWGIDLGKNRSI
jgi:uncharacterized protein